MEILSKTVNETERLGSQLAEHLLKTGSFPAFVALYGDLGAGKTAFVRGFSSVLSPGSRVKSPTYTLVNEYRKGKTPLFHFDLYRIADSDELDGFGFEEYLKNGNCIAEWSENLGDDIPENTVFVKIEKTGESERKITVDGAEI